MKRLSFIVAIALWLLLTQEGRIALAQSLPGYWAECRTREKNYRASGAPDIDLAFNAQDGS